MSRQMKQDCEQPMDDMSTTRKETGSLQFLLEYVWLQHLKSPMIRDSCNSCDEDFSSVEIMSMTKGYQREKLQFEVSQVELSFSSKSSSSLALRLATFCYPDRDLHR